MKLIKKNEPKVLNKKIEGKGYVIKVTRFTISWSKTEVKNGLILSTWMNTWSWSWNTRNFNNSRTKQRNRTKNRNTLLPLVHKS